MSIKFSNLDGNEVWRSLKLENEEFIGSADWVLDKDNKLCCFNLKNKIISIQKNWKFTTDSIKYIINKLMKHKCFFFFII